MTSLRTSVAALVTIALLVVTAAPAWPCMNAVELSKNAATKRLKEAEALLAAGEPGKASNLVNGRVRFPSKMYHRLTLIRAVAALRSGEAPLPWNAFDNDGTVAEYAIEQLRPLVAKGEDPVAVARLAEALAASTTTEHQAEAVKLVEDLASRDLIPDAYGFQTLALVRSRAGNAAGVDAALARCRQVAGKAHRDRICKVPTSPS